MAANNLAVPAEPLDLTKFTGMVQKKLSEKKRFVKFDERKDDNTLSIELFKIWIMVILCSESVYADNN